MAAGVTSQTMSVEQEPNETIAQANTLGLPARVTGNVRYGDAAAVEFTYSNGQVDKVEDLFKLVVPAKETYKVEISLTFNNPSADVDLMLFRLDKGRLTALAVSNGSETTERINPPPTLTEGEYFVGVSAYDDPGNTSSTGYTLSLLADGPAPPPTIASISPVSAPAGGDAFSLTVNGSNFIAGQSIVRWNDQPRLTTFITSQQLIASISTADIGVSGTARISVANPVSLGGVSTQVPFTILAPGQAEIEVEPNDVSVDANVLLLPGKRAGSVSVGDSSQITIELSNGLSDRIEDLFALTIGESRRVNLRLSGNSTTADLALYIFQESAVSGALTVIGSSRYKGTSQQIITGGKLPPGRYLAGVSAVTGGSQYVIDALTVGDRLLQLVTTNGAPGSAVTIPLNFIAEGDEKIMSFSVWFDPKALSGPQFMPGADLVNAQVILNQTQIAQGKLGVEIRLPDGQSLPSGQREIGRLNLLVGEAPGIGATDITFGDQPVARLLYNRDNQSLIGTYASGSVIIQPGIEADVSPRPNGSSDNRVTIADWAQVGRFAAGLDSTINGGEFQRADCSPVEGRGDGRLTIADWVQAGRYAAGLESVTPAGGPTIRSVSLMQPQLWPFNESQFVYQSIDYDRSAATIESRIDIHSDGNIAGAGFSLRFDPSLLSLIDVAVIGISAIPGSAQIIVNTDLQQRGLIGIAIVMPPEQSIVRGTHHLLRLRFNSSSDHDTTIVFDDTPVIREVVDRWARPLSTGFIVVPTECAPRP